MIRNLHFYVHPENDGRELKARKRANASVQRAVRRGELINPGVCSVCHKDGAIAHHDDYSKPLDVTWLCRKCHQDWHAINKAVATI